MRRMSALAVWLTIAAPFSAWSQTHTAEDEAACTPDVMKLCQQHVPNRQNIIACMVENKRNLSAECHAVFSRPMTPQRAAGDEQQRRRKTPRTHSPD